MSEKVVNNGTAFVPPQGKIMEQQDPEKFDIFVRGHWTCLAIENEELCFEDKGDLIIVSKLYKEIAKISFSRQITTIAFKDTGKKQKLTVKHIRQLLQVAFQNYLVS